MDNPQGKVQFSTPRFFFYHKFINHTERIFSHLQVFQSVLQPLHGLAQMLDGFSGVARQIAHGVLTVLLPARASAPLAVSRVMRCGLAARKFGVQFLDGALLTRDGLPLLQHGLPELHDRASELVLLRARALHAVIRVHRAAEVGSRRDSGAHEALALRLAIRKRQVSSSQRASAQERSKERDHSCSARQTVQFVCHERVRLECPKSPPVLFFFFKRKKSTIKRLASQEVTNI